MPMASNRCSRASATFPPKSNPRVATIMVTWHTALRRIASSDPLLPLSHVSEVFCGLPLIFCAAVLDTRHIASDRAAQRPAGRDRAAMDERTGLGCRPIIATNRDGHKPSFTIQQIRGRKRGDTIQACVTCPVASSRVMKLRWSWVTNGCTTSAPARRWRPLRPQTVVPIGLVHSAIDNISVRHGGHQVAQKVSKITRPRKPGPDLAWFHPDPAMQNPVPQRFGLTSA